VRLETPGIEVVEKKAAGAISELASDIEQLCYIQDARGIAPATVAELKKSFRVLKRACVFYQGDEHGLVYEPPDGKFQKKGIIR
jgi:hypothetical protein